MHSNDYEHTDDFNFIKHTSWQVFIHLIIKNVLLIILIDKCTDNIVWKIIHQIYYIQKIHHLNRWIFNNMTWTKWY